jgi:hypothetical protein
MVALTTTLISFPLLQITKTAVTENFQYDSTVTKAFYLFMSMDSILYSANSPSSLIQC